MKMTNKIWIKPQLKVIIRHTENEAILSTCKVTKNTLGQANAATGCSVKGRCAVCQGTVAS